MNKKVENDFVKWCELKQSNMFFRTIQSINTQMMISENKKINTALWQVSAHTEKKTTDDWRLIELWRWKLTCLSVFIELNYSYPTSELSRTLYMNVNVIELMIDHEDRY